MWFGDHYIYSNELFGCGLSMGILVSILAAVIVCGAMGYAARRDCLRAGYQGTGTIEDWGNIRACVSLVDGERKAVPLREVRANLAARRVEKSRRVVGVSLVALVVAAFGALVSRTRRRVVGCTE